MKFLIKFWPLAAILFLVALFFYPVWLQNKIPLPADFVIGTYYPWLDYKWGGYGAGVPVKNPITTDVVSFIFPMQMLSIDLLKQGIFPLWNEYILGGTPLLANFQSAPFSPTNFLYFIFSSLDAWSLQIITQPLLAALFTFLLLRHFGLDKLPSIYGGLAFAFAGFNTIWMQWNGHTLTAAFFPLIFLLTIKWLKTHHLIWGILFSLCLALQIFSGYPQIILYEMLGILIICLFFLDLRRMVDLGFFLFLGISLAGLQILPAFELLKYSQRSIEDVLNVSAFLPWQYIITFLAPDYFGNHSTFNFWGQGDYTLVTGFSGVVTIVLATIALIGKIKNKLVLLSASFIILSFLISLPNPLSIMLKESGLFGLQAASAHRSLVLSNLGFALLAAFGLQMLQKKEVNLKIFIRATYSPAILLIGFLIGTFIIYQILLNSPEINMPITAKNIVNFKVAMRNLILPVMTLFSLFCLGFISIRNKHWSFIPLIIFALSIFELFRFGWKFTPFSSKEFIFPSTPVIEFLQKNRENYRVVAEDVIPINLTMPYKMETVEGYDAVYPLRTAKYLSVLNSENPLSNPIGRYGSIKNYDSNLLNLASGKYILALKRNKIRAADENGKIPDEFEKTHLKKVFEDKTVVVLENQLAIPRTKMFYEWEVISDEKQILERLLSKDFQSDKKIILENEPGLETKKTDSIINFSTSPNNKLLSVKTENAGLVFISDTWFPGWKAFVDGKEKPILRANYNFMAIVIEPGEHKINLEYKPTSFEIGKMVSFFAGGILSVLGLVALIKHARS